MKKFSKTIESMKSVVVDPLGDPQKKKEVILRFIEYGFEVPNIFVRDINGWVREYPRSYVYYDRSRGYVTSGEKYFAPTMDANEFLAKFPHSPKHERKNVLHQIIDRVYSDSYRKNTETGVRFVTILGIPAEGFGFQKLPTTAIDLGVDEFVVAECFRMNTVLGILDLDAIKTESTTYLENLLYFEAIQEQEILVVETKNIPTPNLVSIAKFLELGLFA